MPVFIAMPVVTAETESTG